MNFRFEKLGWFITAGLATFLVVSGFDTPTSKVGVVNISKVITGSDLDKKAGDALQVAYQQRKDLIDYVNAYPVFTVAQANRLRELWLKAPLTAAETTELTKLKADVKAQDTRYRALQQKQNPTAQDKTDLDDYGKRVQALGQLIGDWRQAFTDELSALQEKSQQATQEAARTAIQTVGKAQSFTLILNSDVAPFGQNDTTADVLKAMNKK